PNRIDSGLNLGRCAVRLHGEAGFVTKHGERPFRLSVEVLLMDVGRGDRRVDQVSQFRVDRNALSDRGVVPGEIAAERFAGTVDPATAGAVARPVDPFALTDQFDTAVVEL